MEKELHLERENLLNVEAELRTETQLLENVRLRGPESQLKLNGKTKELSDLEEKFAVTLKQIARGEKEEGDLTKVRVRMDSLKIEIQNLKDLTDILKRTEVESVARVGALGEKVRGQTHSFWFSVSIYESEKIKESDAGAVLRSYGAYVLSGLPENFGNFLQNKFNGFQIDLTEIIDSLKKEYLSTTSQKGGK